MIFFQIVLFFLVIVCPPISAEFSQATRHWHVDKVSIYITVVLRCRTYTLSYLHINYTLLWYHLGHCVFLLLVVFISCSLSTVCTARVDLGFLIDATSSARRYLKRVVQFMQETVRRFTISSSATRIGVVTYASRARRIIGLSGAYSRRRIYTAVGRIRILRGGRRLGRALSYARLYLFRGKPQCGRRRVLIVLAAGRSLDRVRRPADALKGVGVEIFAIGLGSVSRRSLLKVTTDTKHVFAVGSTRLLSIVRTLKDRICYSPGKLTTKWHMTKGAQAFRMK